MLFFKTWKKKLNIFLEIKRLLCETSRIWKQKTIFKILKFCLIKSKIDILKSDNQTFLLPFFILMTDKKFIQLLSLEFKFVFSIFFDSIFVRNGIVLSSQVGLEWHHKGLDPVGVLGGLAPTGSTPSGAPGTSPTPAASTKIAAGRWAIIAPLITIIKTSTTTIMSVFPKKSNQKLFEAVHSAILSLFNPS